MDWSVKVDLTPLVETTSKGLQHLGRLVFGDRLNDRAYRDALMAAQTERDAGRVRRGEQVFIPEAALAPVQAIAYRQEWQQEYENFARNLSIAAERLQDVPPDDISDDIVDPDWFARWRREAKVIGNPELQTLWGRILAEEVKRPQSVSCRSLDVLKNLTRADAKLFSRVAHFRLLSAVVCPKHVLDIGDPAYPINLQQVVTLVDAGLVISTQPVVFGANAKDGMVHFFTGAGTIVGIEVTQENLSAFVPGISLSQAGLEIAKIADIEPITQDTLKYFVKCIACTRPNLVRRIYVHPLNGGNADPNIVLFEYIP